MTQQRLLNAISALVQVPILLKPIIKYFWWLIMSRTLNSCVFLGRLYSLSDSLPPDCFEDQTWMPIEVWMHCLVHSWHQQTICAALAASSVFLRDANLVWWPWLVAQSCPTLCNPLDCSPPGSSVHGILQAECWSGLPFPSPGALLPKLGIEMASPAWPADSLLSEPPPSIQSSKAHWVLPLGAEHWHESWNCYHHQTTEKHVCLTLVRRLLSGIQRGRSRIMYLIAGAIESGRWYWG